MFGLGNAGHHNLTEIFVNGDVQDGCGNTMNGGKIIVRGSIKNVKLGKEVCMKQPDNSEIILIKKYTENFCRFFGTSLPHTHRPYGKIYAY